MRSNLALVAVIASVAALGCGDDSGDGDSDEGRADAAADDPSEGTGDASVLDRDGGFVPAGPDCGNGVLNTDEQCEGFDLREATCESEGFSAGFLSCADDCSYDTSECTRCGDGEISGAEVCEPDDLDGATCESEVGPMYVGTVECAPDCTSLVTTDCHQEIPAQNFRACDPDAADPCSDPAHSCLTTSAGDFCLEGCDRTDRGSCGVNTRVCYDFDGVGICVDVPGEGEVCTTATGCNDGRLACIPTFNPEGGPEVSICAVPCAASLIGTGGGCGTDLACVPVPGGQVELESQTPCSIDASCDQASGYRCLPTAEDGSTPPLCARPVSLCATPLPFYAFDGASTLGSVCDLESPSQGTNLCGIGENAQSQQGTMASATCYPLRSGTPGLGVCVGFCDSAVLNTVSDGFCGDGFVCAEPSEPEFFLAGLEASPQTCDPAAPVCPIENPLCLDLGRGPECARPTKMCIPQ